MVYLQINVRVYFLCGRNKFQYAFERCSRKFNIFYQNYIDTNVQIAYTLKCVILHLYDVESTCSSDAIVAFLLGLQ
jgi:hypothetical protein